MALADLLLKMEGRATDTPDTPCNPSEVSAKPLQDKACTLDTPDTSQNISAEDWALFNAWLFHFTNRSDLPVTFAPAVDHAAALTEQHLVEELAAIIWRKRRVLLAEGAQINRGLRSATKSRGEASPAVSAAPFECVGLSVESTELADLMAETPAQIAESQREAAIDMAATDKAAAILHKSGPNAYARALRALQEDSRDWWEGEAGKGNYPANAEGLAQFIDDELWPLCHAYDKQARYTPAIQVQTLGEGLQVHRLEKLNRYETHLDRKFERTLAMLLKLKDLHGA